MIDLETRLRDLLHEDAARAPSPPDSSRAIGRTRRRQATLIASSGLAIVAAGVLVVAGLRAVTRPSTPAAPKAEHTVNGVTMRVPATWNFVDPVKAGLQPEGDTLPQIIAVLSAVEPSSILPCPGRTPIGRDGFVMTLLEAPLALDGAAAHPWPVDLESMEAAESPCYPGWESLGAAWTTAGRTFEARVGFGPDATDEDRTAVLVAFASMEFQEARQEPMTIALATGTAAGQEWELVASRDADGLVLGLEWRTGGSRMGGLHDRRQSILLRSQVFGTGDDARVVVFGAAAPRVARVELRPELGGPAESAEVIDVPDGIDPQLNAFIMVAAADLPAILTAYDAAGSTVTQVSVEETLGDTPVP